MMRHVKMWWTYATVIIYLTNLTLGDQPKIIIVGAGPAGVAAAAKLYENGFENITILEAENRIGGRVYTTWFDQRPIDLGAQWVHGQTNNIAFQLAEPLGLLEVPEKDMDPIIYNSEGVQLPISIGNELINLGNDLDERAFEELKENNGSVGEYFTRMLNIEAMKLPGVNQTLIQQFTKVLEGHANAEDASDNWYKTSARGYLEAWPCPGSHVVNWKDRSYGTIIDILMKKYPNPEDELPIRDNTILNREVVNIDYNSTEGKVLVKLSNGDKYLADHVIVTPSLGVLKEQYQTLFTPELPESKVKSIQGLAMGHSAKIFLLFDTEWWPNNSTAFILMWTQEDRQEYESDPNKKWLLDLITFSPVEHKPRILYCWLNAPGAHYMETLPEHQVFNQIVGLMYTFLGQSYNVTRPIGMLRSNWYNNKHFRGTYSFRSMESEAVGASAEELGAPLVVNDKPVVMFAGEATHPHYFGMVHGAIETGFREADRLIEMYNIAAPKCETTKTFIISVLLFHFINNYCVKLAFE